MFKRNWHYLLLIFIVLDSCYSFWQHLHVELDGDMAAIILPSAHYEQVQEDPFGLRVLLNKEVYAGPNRFFAHKFLSDYFKTVPLLLQRWFSSIDSIYQACAWLKTSVQVLLLYLLSVYISGTYRVLTKRFLVVAALLVPIFQTAGFNNQMGIIDKSITYTVFYALPLALLLCFFLPFYRSAFANDHPKTQPTVIVLLLLLAVVLAFNGPLIPGVVVLVCPLALWLAGQKRAQFNASLSLPAKAVSVGRSIPSAMLLCFGFILILCLYSLYIGRSNSENFDGRSIPVLERYSRLPFGFYEQLRQKLGLPLLLLAVLFNAYLIKRQPTTPKGQKILTGLRWFGWFALAYILLLPLGGYRPYRPHILRRDVITPIVLGLTYFYGISTLYLLTHLPQTYRSRYQVGLGVFLAIFMFSDKPIVSNNNACEKQLLAQLAQSPEQVVRLPSSCTLISWTQTTDPSESATNAALLHYWHVIDAEKRYYQQPDSW